MNDQRSEVALAKLGTIVSLVGLRNLLPRDKELIRLWRNKPTVASRMFTQHDIGLEEHARWFERISADSAFRHWIIMYADRPVGVVNLANIDSGSRRSEFGIYLGEDDIRGKGIGSCAQYLLMEFVFGSMELDELWCEVLANNEDALKMYRGLGLRQVREEVKHTSANAESFNICRLAISRKEWLRVREPVAKRLREKNLL